MPNDLMNQFLADATAVSATTNELGDISKLAQDQRDWENKIIQLTSDLDAAKEALRQIQEFLLPEAMAAIGMTEFKMLDGSKITIREDVYASIRKDYIHNAVAWLDSVGLGDVVKNEVSVNFGRGESDAAYDLIDYCKEHGYNAGQKESVHPQTLKALVKEQLARGVEFPEEYFSIAPVKKAIIKTK